jgi:hypothetical protein
LVEAAAEEEELLIVQDQFFGVAWAVLAEVLEEAVRVEALVAAVVVLEALVAEALAVVVPEEAGSCITCIN